MLRIILLLPLVVVVACPNSIRAQTPESPTEVWPEFTVNYDPIRKVRLMLAIRKETSEDTPDKTLETTATIIYRIRPLVRNMIFDDEENDNEKKYMLSFAANYEFSRTFGSSTIKNEQRIMLDATPRYKLPGRILLENRVRSEFRWRDDGVYDYWFRTRLRVEKTFRLRKLRFAPYVYVEPMWTKYESAWNRNLLSAGVEVAVIRKRARVDLSYLRKNCDTCSQPDVNAIGINFLLFFGKR
jgi:hypothetical protein